MAKKDTATPTLFELTATLAELNQMLDSEEIDEQTINDTLEAVKGEIGLKCDNYAFYIKQLEQKATGLRDTAAGIINKAKSIENMIDRMKNAIRSAVEETDGQKIEGSVFKFAMQKNPASVVLDEQYIENLPEKYLKVTTDVNRSAIKDDIKNGVNLDGIAHLESTYSLRIR